MSGNWQIGGFVESIQGAFDWEAVLPPCGPGGCTGMPGGSVLVGYNETDHPAEVAAFIDFMAREDNYRTWVETNLLIPQHAGLIEAGLDFSAAARGRSSRAHDLFRVCGADLTDRGAGCRVTSSTGRSSTRCGIA